MLTETPSGNLTSEQIETALAEYMTIVVSLRHRIIYETDPTTILRLERQITAVRMELTMLVDLYDRIVHSAQERHVYGQFVSLIERMLKRTEKYHQVVDPIPTELFLELDTINQKLNDLLVGQLNIRVDIRQSFEALYFRLDHQEQRDINLLLEFIRQNKIDTRLLLELLELIQYTLAQWDKLLQDHDENLQQALSEFQQAINSGLSVTQKIEATLPLVPGILEYKFEVGAGSNVDLNRLLEEIRTRWQSLKQKIIKNIRLTGRDKR